MEVTFKTTQKNVFNKQVCARLMYQHGSFISIQDEYMSLSIEPINLDKIKCHKYTRSRHRIGRPVFITDVKDVEINLDLNTGTIITKEVDGCDKHFVLLGIEIKASRTNV